MSEQTKVETDCSRIVGLHAENVMRLKVVDLTPPEHLVVVAGDNEQGKSSLLTAIEMALAGADAFPAMPVRKGQKRAVIDLDLGSLTVHRTVSPTGATSLVVKAKDGQVLNSPQKILDELRGKRSFDPMEFMRLKPEARADQLRRIAGLDFAAHEQSRAALFTERTAANRDVEKAKSKLAALPAKFSDAPEAEQSTAAILAEQQKASEHNALNAEARRRVSESLRTIRQHESAVTSAANAVEANEREIARLQELLVRSKAGLETLRGDLADAKIAHGKAEAAAAKLTDIDLSGFQQKLSGVEAANRKIRSNHARDAAQKEFSEASAKANGLTRKIDALDAKKAEDIQNAKYPVAGLGFTDTGVVAIDGIPFEQCSTSKQLRVSVAIGLAMNPKLRLLLIRNGNDLDDANMKLLAEMARESKAQICIERVSKTGEVAVIIEDGMVRQEADELEARFITAV